MAETKERSQLNFRRIILILLDVLCIVLAGYGALLLRFNGPVPNKYLDNLTVMLIPVIACGLIIFYYFRVVSSSSHIELGW